MKINGEYSDDNKYDQTRLLNEMYTNPFKFIKHMNL